VYSRHNLLRACVVVGLCLLVGAGGVAVADAAEHTTNQTDNRTLHENPEEAAERGDLSSVQNWLGGRMSEIHVNCAENLSVGESIACERLDEEYPEFLEQYASVERDRTGEDETARTFEQARDNQSELADETRNFQETYEEYQNAREAGDEERSRRLARELGESAERIEALSDSLNTLFLALESQTGRDFGDALIATNETVEEVLETTAEVQQTEFRPANLTADVDAETASFRRPATVSGRLTNESGVPLADREIRIVVDDRTVATTETDVLGRYNATYRPVTTTTGPTTVRAVYDPTGAGVYLGTEATAGVDVEADRPSLLTDADVETAAFGDAVPVSGTVTVAAIAAPDVPVSVYLDGERLATGTTDESGDVELEGTVPATVPDGERTLSIRASRPGTALEPAYENQSITVEETETNLTVDGLLDGEELVIRGRLTADGRSVPNQPVSVSVDGEIRKRVRTNGEGAYELRIPRETGATDVWAVTVEYDNPESNLAPASSTDRLRANELEATNGTERPGGGVAGQIRQAASRFEFLGFVEDLSDGQLIALAVVLLVLVVLGPIAGGYYLYRREDETESEAEDGPTPAVVDVSDDAADGGTASADAPDGSEAELARGEVLDVARARLGNGNPTEAVEIGYGAVRRELGDGSDPEAADTRTHWEFYRDLEAEIPDEHSRALERLTEAYEQAAFAPRGASHRTARDALEAASECLDPAPTPDGGPESE